MNILITKFPYNSQMGGGEVHTLQLFSELKRRGHNFYLASSCNVLIGEFMKRSWPAKKTWIGREPVSMLGILLYALRMPLTFWQLIFLLLKYRIRRKTKKLYCLSLTEKLLATIPARLMGYSVFWIEHLRIERWLALNPFLLCYIFNSYFATTIAVSQAVRGQLIDLGLSKNKVKVIYNGIDIKKFHPQKISKPQPEKLIIGTVCRLCPEKGVDYLIKAFGQAINKNNELLLMIVGEGPEKENLKNLARDKNISDKVFFLGWQDDIPRFLNSIDIFALTPTRRESFGISAGEASACGLPVVATDISGLSEVVSDNETGLVVESKNIDKIASAIVRLANDENLREDMGKAGRKRVIENFTIEQMIDNFEKVMKEN